VRHIAHRHECLPDDRSQFIRRGHISYSTDHTLNKESNIQPAMPYHIALTSPPPKGMCRCLEAAGSAWHCLLPSPLVVVVVGHRHHLTGVGTTGAWRCLLLSLLVYRSSPHRWSSSVIASISLSRPLAPAAFHRYLWWCLSVIGHRHRHLLPSSLVVVIVIIIVGHWLLAVVEWIWMLEN